MEQEHHLAFGPFHLDGPQGRLWQGAQVIPLRPQPLALLRYLVAHPGRLVTKTELRQHVWAGTHVTDTVLRVSVHEIRQALGDVAAAPQYLETVGRQGYRFLLGDALEVTPPLTSGPLVGRQGDVEAVEQCFQRAAQGARQLVLLSGEAGIGKTTVVEMVLARLGTGNGVRMARGQCAEHYGEGEPYLPLLEALGQLCRGPRHPDVVAVLRRYAPLWLGPRSVRIGCPRERATRSQTPTATTWRCFPCLTPAVERRWAWHPRRAATVIRECGEHGATQARVAL